MVSQRGGRDLYLKINNIRKKHTAFSTYFLKKPPNVRTFLEIFDTCVLLKMVLTRPSGAGTRKLRKGSSSSKRRIFYQDRSTMDPIDVEPLRLAPPLALVSYGKSKEGIPVAVGRPNIQGSVDQPSTSEKLMDVG